MVEGPRERRRIVTTRSGDFATTLAPGLYQVEGPDGAQTLMVGDDGEVAWSGATCRPSQRVPAFGIVAGDPIWPGGVERWMEHLVQVQDPPCLGVAFETMTKASFGAQQCLAMLRAHVPVEIGIEAVREMTRRAAVLIDWRCAALPGLLSPSRSLRPRIVRASHSPPECRWALDHYRQVAPYTDTWVGVSKSAVDCIPNQGHTVPIIPNAVGPVPSDEGLEETKAFYRAHLGLDASNQKLACILTRFGREKRPDFGLALARALPADWKVLIAGLGYEFDRIAGEVMRDADLRRRVIMPGALDAWTAIALSNAVIVPSEYESFCRVIAEAWLMGKPVASTPVGLAAEYLDWVYPIGPSASENDAADVAAWLERGAPMAMEVQLAAQEHIWVHHDLETFIKSWSTLLASEVRHAMGNHATYPPQTGQSD